MVRVHPYRITRTTEQECIVVEGNGRFHRERVEQAREGTSTKAFEGTLTPDDLKQLSAILGSDEFLSTHNNTLNQAYRFGDKKLSIDVWRKNNQKQSLYFPDEEIADKYNGRLDALLQWWKTVAHEEAPATKDVTGCRVIPHTPSEQAGIAAATPNSAGANPVPAASARFGEMRLWQGVGNAFSGTLKQKCMVVERDGSFHREETSQGLNGTRSKVFAGKLSPAEEKELAQIVATPAFRLLVHLKPPERVILNWSDPAVSMGVWWSDGSEQIYFPDTLSRKPYKETAVALVKWWDEASKSGVEIDQNEADSCRPRAANVDDMFPVSTAAQTESVRKSAVPVAVNQTAADLDFSQLRIARNRRMSWYGSIFWGWIGTQRLFDCMTLTPDGKFHAEHRLVFHGQNTVKVVEGTLGASDRKSLQAVFDPDQLFSITTAGRQPADGRVMEQDSLVFQMRRGNHHQRLFFQDLKDRQPYDSTLAPLMHWWQKTSLEFPEAKNATANECSMEGPQRMNGTQGVHDNTLDESNSPPTAVH